MAEVRSLEAYPVPALPRGARSELASVCLQRLAGAAASGGGGGGKKQRKSSTASTSLIANLGVGVDLDRLLDVLYGPRSAAVKTEEEGGDAARTRPGDAEGAAESS